MRKITATLSTIVAGSLLFLGTASADQADVKVLQENSSTQVQEQKQFMSAEKLLGKSIKNDQGQDLGTVKDLLFGTDGELEYVVLSEGGVLGIGEDLIPVPFAFIENDLSVQEDNLVIASLTEDRIKSAPKISEDELDSLEQGAGPAYDEVHAYFKQEDAETDRTDADSMDKSKSMEMSKTMDKSKDDKSNSMNMSKSMEKSKTMDDDSKRMEMNKTMDKSKTTD